MSTKERATFRSLRQSVGIDIANASFETAWGKESSDIRTRTQLSKSAAFDNCESGFPGLIEWAETAKIDLSQCTFVMEATGVYYEALATWLYEQGYRVAVLLPNTVLAFAKSLNIKTKTDQVDATTLAQMGCERNLDLWEPAPIHYKHLKQLTRHREALVHLQTRTKNQLHAAKKAAPACQQVIASQEELIDFICQKIKTVEKQIRSLIRTHQDLKEQYQSVISIPSIGMVTAAALLAETQGFRQFRNKAQLVSYAGYDVIKRQSGTSIKFTEKISKKGNHRIRKALFFPSIIVQNHIPAYEKLYHKINQNNAQTKMKGAVALQRKLLVLAYHLVKTKQTFDPNK